MASIFIPGARMSGGLGTSGVRAALRRARVVVAGAVSCGDEEGGVDPASKAVGESL